MLYNYYLIRTFLIFITVLNYYNNNKKLQDLNDVQFNKGKIMISIFFKYLPKNNGFVKVIINDIPNIVNHIIFYTIVDKSQISK